MSSTLTSILLIERFGNFRSNFLSTLTSLLHMEDSVILGQMFPLLNLPLILGRHKICMIEVESHFLSSWASEWTSLFDYILLVWMKLYHDLALEVRAQPLYVVLLVINLWTNACVFRVYVCMRESVLCLCVCVCGALSSFIGSPFMGHWPLSFMRVL